MKVKDLKILPATHAKLQEIGKKGETFDQIINKLADYYIKNASNSHTTP